jgi:hypothetical protein
MPPNPEPLLMKCPFIKYVDLEVVKAKYPALVAESAREGFITDAVWYSSGLVPVFEAARHKYMTEDLGMKVEEPAVWAKPTSRENRTLIQRDFEHLSHPKRIQERFEFFAAEQALVSQDLSTSLSFCF